MNGLLLLTNRWRCNKMMWHGQCEVTLAHAKVGVHKSKLCRDTASDASFQQIC